MPTGGGGSISPLSQPSLDDVVVFVVGECIGAPLCIAGGEAFVNGQLWRATLGFGLGLPLAIAGVTFHWWKGWLKDSQREWAQLQLGRWWPAAILLLFIYVTGPSFIRRVSSQPRVAAPAIASPSAFSSTPLPEFAKYSNGGKQWPRLPISDGEKWHFAQWMKKIASTDAPPRTCSVLFVRYQLSSAEDLVAALGDILYMANWPYKDKLTLDVLPKGLTVLVPPNSDNHVLNCANDFSNGVRQFAGILTTNYPYAFKSIVTPELTKRGADCIEVQIGNFPDS